MGRGRDKGLTIYLTCIAILFGVGGCDKLPLGGKKEAPKAVAKPPPQPTAPQVTSSSEVGPAQEVQPNYVYDPTGKRDPFQPFIATQTPVRPVDENVPLTPLQKYDLSQLRLVAIIVGTATGEGSALVEDSEGKGYIIKKGVYIGSNFGKVKAVLKDRVIIEERYKDYMGQVREKEIVMRLHPPEEETER